MKSTDRISLSNSFFFFLLRLSSLRISSRICGSNLQIPYYLLFFCCSISFFFVVVFRSFGFCIELYWLWECRWCSEYRYSTRNRNAVFNSSRVRPLHVYTQTFLKKVWVLFLSLAQNSRLGSLSVVVNQSMRKTTL